jgi:hypothetical protein
MKQNLELTKPTIMYKLQSLETRTNRTLCDVIMMTTFLCKCTQKHNNTRINCLWENIVTNYGSITNNRCPWNNWNQLLLCINWGATPWRQKKKKKENEIILNVSQFKWKQSFEQCWCDLYMVQFEQQCVCLCVCVCMFVCWVFVAYYPRMNS